MTNLRKTVSRAKRDKAYRIALLGIGLFLALGASAFLIGYGLKDGWDAVGAWFSSKYAVYCYVGAGFYLFAVAFYAYHRKMRGIADGE